MERYPADPDDLDRYLHYRLITFLGMALGELFALDALADDCAADGVYEGLFTAAPLNKLGGSGIDGQRSRPQVGLDRRARICEPGGACSYVRKIWENGRLLPKPSSTPPLTMIVAPVM